MSYSIPYLLVALGFLTLSVLEAQSSLPFPKWLVRVLCLLLFVFFLGFRGGVGFDCCCLYLPMFSGTDSDFLTYITNVRHETGFMTLTWLIGQFVEDGYFYLTILTILDAVLLHFFVRCNSPWYAFSFFVFYSIDLVFEIDLMRNAKAILIAMLAMPFVGSGQFFRYAAVICVAGLFHSSAYLFLPVYFVLRREYSKRGLWIFFGVMNVIYLSQMPVGLWVGNAIGTVFSERIASYVSGACSWEVRGLSFGYFPKVVLFVLVMLRYDDFFVRFPRAKFFFSLYLCYLFFYLGMSDLSELSRRITYLFEPALCILWPMVIIVYSSALVRSGLSLFWSAYCFLTVFIQTKSPIYEYQNILLNPDAMTQEERTLTKELFHEKQ